MTPFYINQLGARLHQIEQNIAVAIGPELIQRTFGILPDEDFNPYDFTVGWEHKLWKDGVNLRVQTTINMVKIALSLIYISFLLLNVLMMVYQQKLTAGKIWLTSIMAGVFWFVIWFSVFRYLRIRQTEENVPNNANPADAKNRAAD